MMNYYYECTEIELADFTTIIEWDIFSPDGVRIAEATTEENANLIVTLMNGDHSGK